MKIVLYIPIVFGILLFMLSGNLFLKSYELKSKATKVQGIVISLTNENSSLYSSVVEFITKTGKKITFVDGEASNPPTYGKGETVKVLYNENNPKNAKIDNWMSLYFNATLVGFFGLLLTIVSVFGIRMFTKDFINNDSGKWKTHRKIFKVIEDELELTGKIPLSIKLQDIRKTITDKFEDNEKERLEMKRNQLNMFDKEPKYPLEIVLPLSLGIVCLVLAYFSYTNVKKDISNSIKVKAVVLQYSSSPIIGFKTLDGREIKFESPISSSPPMYEKGEVIAVYYDKDYPDKARINSFLTYGF